MYVALPFFIHIHTMPFFLLLTLYADRGQGLNHCITDIFNLVAQIKHAVASEGTWEAGISAYEEEMIPRGSEEVRCSVENGIMLHDWEKVKQSPVFVNGFRPMKGHDTYETNSDHAENQKKAEEARRLRVQNEPAAPEGAP